MRRDRGNKPSYWVRSGIQRTTLLDSNSARTSHELQCGLHQATLLASFGAVCLSLDLPLVAVHTKRAIRCGNALDERISTRLRTNAILLTEVEDHWSIRVRAAHNALCTVYSSNIMLSFNQSGIVPVVAKLLDCCCCGGGGGGGSGGGGGGRTYHMGYSFRFLLEEHHTSSVMGTPVDHVSICESR